MPQEKAAGQMAGGAPLFRGSGTIHLTSSGLSSTSRVYRRPVRVLAWLLAFALAGCAPAPVATPSLDPRSDRAVQSADVEAGRLLGTDARPVFRQFSATLRGIYGDRAGADRGADDPGLFAVYASPGSGLFAEVFVRYDGARVTFSTVTRDPVRR